jgi:hypothetical protein
VTFEVKMGVPEARAEVSGLRQSLLQSPGDLRAPARVLALGCRRTELSLRFSPNYRTPVRT